MRPLRWYVCRYIRQNVPAGDTALRELQIQSAGRTPCKARANAFQQLEQRIRRDNLPRLGWKLISQTQAMVRRA